MNCSVHNLNSDKGESEGYTVKSKDEDFAISDYPLLQTEFFYDQKQGMDIVFK